MDYLILQVKEDGKHQEIKRQMNLYRKLKPTFQVFLLWNYTIAEKIVKDSIWTPNCL